MPDKWSDPRKRNLWESEEDKRKKFKKRNRKSDREDAEAAARAKTDIQLSPEHTASMQQMDSSQRMIGNFQRLAGHQGLSTTMSLHDLMISSGSDIGLIGMLSKAGIPLQEVQCAADLFDFSKKTVGYKLLNGLDNVGAVVDAVNANPSIKQFSITETGTGNWSDKLMLTVTLSHTQKETLRGYVSAQAKAAGITFP